MIINKHGSFYIRETWPSKILQEVRKNPHVFSPSAELQAVDAFGLGRVMIKALRYWANALGLTIEKADSQGLLSQETDLFRIIYNNDIYCQNNATLYLLHRELALNKDYATAWYWLYNEYPQGLIRKDSFCEGFNAFLSINGETYNKSSIEKEFNCLKNTYASDGAFSIDKILEDNISPFFGDINLLEKTDRETYAKRKIGKNDIPAQIILFCIINDNYDDVINKRQISIDKLVDDKCQIGRYFNLSYSVIIEILQELENNKKIKMNNNFGNRHIEILCQSPLEQLLEYYCDTKEEAR